MKPVPKVTAAAVGGAVVTLLVAFNVVEPNSETAAAVASIVAVAFGYVKK